MCGSEFSVGTSLIHEIKIVKHDKHDGTEETEFEVCSDCVNQIELLFKGLHYVVRERSYPQPEQP